MGSIFRFLYNKKDKGIYRYHTVLGIKIVTKPLDLILWNMYEIIGQAKNDVARNDMSLFFVSENVAEVKNTLQKQGIPCVSAIVSVYNLGERYLRPCIESLVNQTLKNIEIIIVNDCSPLEEDDIICKEYAAKDSRIKYIKNNENRGAYYSRWHGYSFSTGHSVHFVDGDDYLALHAYEVLFNQMAATNVDIITFGYVPFDDNPEKPNQRTINLNNYRNIVPFLMYGDAIFTSYLMFDHIIGSIWDKFYNGTLLKQIKNESFEGIPVSAFFEDNLHNMKTLYHVKSLINLDAKLYFYRNRGSSAINSISESHIQNFTAVFERAFHYFDSNNLDVKYEHLFVSLTRNIYHLYSRIEEFSSDNSAKNKKDIDIDYSNKLILLFTDSISHLVNLYRAKIDDEEIHKIFMESIKHFDEKILIWYEENILPRLKLKE